MGELPRAGARPACVRAHCAKGHGVSTIRVRWNRDADGFVDRHGRTATRCRAEAQAAAALADATRRIINAIDADSITLGREAGPKLVGRFLLNAQVLDAIAGRDKEIAGVLEQASADERQRSRDDLEA